MSVSKEEINGISSNHLIVIDANCCIFAAIAVERYNITGRFYKQLRHLIFKCNEKCVTLGFYEIIKIESEKNLFKELNNITGFQQLSSSYVKMNCHKECRDNLDRYFKNKAKLCQMSATTQEISDCKEFYTQHKSKRSSYQIKPDVPCENDLKILISTKNLTDYEVKRITTEDSDFTSFKPEIKTTYDIDIMALDELPKYFHEWKWD